MTESAYKIWWAGLGAVAYAQETGEHLFTDLVKRGREMEARARLTPPDMTDTVRSATGRAMSAWQQITKGLDEQVTVALHSMGVPTRSEIATLSKRVELLTASIERLKPKARAVAKPATAPRASAPSGAAKS
jgi:poly(hydroxyalkanoate) granule-associated protein